MRDIACADYVAGCNTKFFASGRTSGGLTEVSAEKCKENMMKRLAFADDVGAPYDSMLAFPAAAGQFINGALDTVMSITSRCARLRWTRRPVQMGVLWADRRRVPRRRLLPWEVQSTSRPNSHNSFPGGEGMYVKYANALQLHSIHFGEDMKASENMEFIVLLCAARTPPPFHDCDCGSPLSRSRRPAVPGLDKQCIVFHRAAPPLRPVCARLLLARARTRSLWTRCYSVRRILRTKRHRAHALTLPSPPIRRRGDARWRRGESVSLKTARDSMVSIELAAQAQMIYQKK